MDLGEKIINGCTLSFAEAQNFLLNESLETILNSANKVREHFLGNKIETCSIINARSGRCPENCKWCAQSAHNKTGVNVYPLMPAEEILNAARAAQNLNIGRFSIVTSGRAQKGDDFEKICATFSKLNSELKIDLCGSLGLLDKAQLKKLKAAGMTRYHCNLESAPSFFGKLCTTHTIEEKIQTIKWALEEGIEVCSGGIIGMGETQNQRIELAITLREIGVKSIPINVLQPIKGTPLENAKALSAEEILKCFAIFRLINPKAQIRFAGGRSSFADFQEKALKSGVSAAIVGDMLTTLGSTVADDFALLKKLGYEF